MEAPEKIYLVPLPSGRFDREWFVNTIHRDDTEYTRTDAFIEKARKWFEKQPETYDANGVRCYGTEDFEDFVNYMKRG